MMKASNHILLCLAIVFLSGCARPEGKDGVELARMTEPSILLVEPAGAKKVQPVWAHTPQVHVDTPLYAVTGDVRYKGVQGAGYLEMWSTLGQHRFFSRTLAEVGPMRKLTGTSDWRSFVLPADKSGSEEKLHSILLNVVLPEGGEVELRNVRFMIYPDQNLSEVLSPEYAWWTERQAGWIGGAGGVLLGLLGATIGFTARRLPRIAQVAGMALGVLGGLCIVAGIISVAARQPYAVYYPLLLMGVIGAATSGLHLWLARRRNLDQELRRISALDSASSY